MIRQHDFIFMILRWWRVLVYIYYVGVCAPEQTLAVRVGEAEHVVM